MEAIDKFIENWKIEIKKYYTDVYNQWINDPVENYKEDIITSNTDLAFFKSSFTIKAEYYNKKHGKGTMQLVRHCFCNIDKMIESDAKNKKAKLIKQVEKKAGKIVDATGLRFGVDCGINGTIIGELKTVHVETIYAGGYNIQCLHYRVLVK